MREICTSGSMSGDWKQGLGYCVRLRLYLNQHYPINRFPSVLLLSTLRAFDFALVGDGDFISKL
jgi:hypothetical protein